MMMVIDSNSRLDDIRHSCVMISVTLSLCDYVDFLLWWPPLWPPTWGRNMEASQLTVMMDYPYYLILVVGLLTVIFPSICFGIVFYIHYWLGGPGGNLIVTLPSQLPTHTRKIVSISGKGVVTRTFPFPSLGNRKWSSSPVEEPYPIQWRVYYNWSICLLLSKPYCVWWLW